MTGWTIPIGIGVWVGVSLAVALCLGRVIHRADHRDGHAVDDRLAELQQAVRDHLRDPGNVRAVTKLRALVKY